MLAWADSDFEDKRGGSRDSGHGTYLLFVDGRLHINGRMERPNCGKVCDAGTFILEDWMFGNQLNGIFYAFNEAGEILVQKKFSANLYNSGLADDGSCAVCNTCVSEDETDSSIVAVYDLQRRIERSRFLPITGPGHTYTFEPEREIIHFLMQDGRDYRYSYDGDFLDVETWEKDRLERASGYELLAIAQKQLENLEGNELSAFAEPLAHLQKALSLDVSEYYQARIHRAIGETMLKCGERAKAIHHFEAALKCDPKVGVKKTLADLKR